MSKDIWKSQINLKNFLQKSQKDTFFQSKESTNQLRLSKIPISPCLLYSVELFLAWRHILSRLKGSHERHLRNNLNLQRLSWARSNNTKMNVRTTKYRWIIYPCVKKCWKSMPAASISFQLWGTKRTK